MLVGMVSNVLTKSTWTQIHTRLLGFTGSTFGKRPPERDHTPVVAPSPGPTGGHLHPTHLVPTTARGPTDSSTRKEASGLPMSAHHATEAGEWLGACADNPFASVLAGFGNHKRRAPAAAAAEQEEDEAAAVGVAAASKQQRPSKAASAKASASSKAARRGSGGGARSKSPIRSPVDADADASAAVDAAAAGGAAGGAAAPSSSSADSAAPSGEASAAAAAKPPQLSREDKYMAQYIAQIAKAEKAQTDLVNAALAEATAEYALAKKSGIKISARELAARINAKYADAVHQTRCINWVSSMPRRSKI